MELKRYWFRIKNNRKLPPGIIMRCGITAFNLQDAKDLLSKNVFKNEPFEIEEFKEDVDISTLEDSHILQNMYIPHKRGVWFPLGYE